MLTPTDLKNIRKFKELNLNHQRVFKHRLIKKCVSAPKDMKFVLLNHEKLNLKVDKIIDIIKLTELLKLLEIYEDLTKLQNM